MKILLAHPIRGRERILNIVAPVGLGYLATALRQKDHEAVILDCVKEGMDFSNFEDFVIKIQPQVVGFTAYSSDLLSVNKSINSIKQIDPSITTVVGGPHPSGDPEGVLHLLDRADYAFAGEGEIGLPILADFLSKGVPGNGGLRDIPGLIWRNDHAIVCNPPSFPQNLDSLGFPSWDLIRPGQYRGIPNGVFSKMSPFAPIVTTRGCPFPCTFCAAKRMAGRKIRKRSVANVMEEIDLLYHIHGIREIHFEDDNFTFEINFAKEVCRELIRKNSGMSFSSPNGIRLDRVDEELLRLMKEAGWYRLYVGIESGSARILKAMRKGLTKELIRERLKLMRKIGFETAGYFIVGYPGETRKDLKETVSFAKTVDLDWAHFAAFLPLPGTEVVDMLKSNGEFTDIQWDSCFNTEVPYSPQGISKSELKGWQRKAFLSFYFRPSQLIRLLLNIRLHNIRLITRRIFSYLFR